MPEERAASCEVNRLTVLDLAGNADPKLEPKISDGELRAMYEEMVLARVFDRKAFSLQRQGRSYTFANAEGEEACQIGSCHALDAKSDWIFPTYREHPAMISFGVPMERIFLYWMGSEEGLRHDKNVFPICIAVGTHPLHSVGMALAFKNQGKKAVTMPFFGDGATSEGDVMEAMNFAGVLRTPTVFLCQNNYYAISVPLAKQTAAPTLAQKACAFGIEGLQVDGMDVLAVYSAAKRAADKARQGNGPTLIECLTYRFGPHTTADDPTKYRTQAEVDEWRKKDPLPRFEKYLAKKGLWDAGYAKTVLEGSQAKVEAAVAKAEELVKQLDPKDMLKNVVSGPPAQRAAEQEALLDEFLKDGI